MFVKTIVKEFRERD